MPPSIKWVGRETSILSLYRNILKSCARHPDPYVGEWYACRWRDNFKKWFAQSPPPAPEDVAHLMRKARSIILRLQRASSGDKQAFDFTVERAYGGTGIGRWPLLKPFTRSRVLPPKISILRDRPDRTLPSYSPFLVSAADSPLMMDVPRPPLRLALPETLPPHGVPANPELINRQFIDPARETNIRKQYYNALLERIKVPLCVRVVGVQEKKSEGEQEQEGKNLWDRLRELGIDWREFSDGRREVLLDRLEQFAGKGGAKAETTPKIKTRRTPVNEIDPSLPPPPPPPSSTLSPSSSGPSSSSPSHHHPSLPPLPPPSFPIPRSIHHSSLTPARFPHGYQQIYRHLLSNFPLLTVDLSRVQPPGQWLAIQFSPYSTNGSAFYYPVDPIEDLPYLRLELNSLTNAGDNNPASMEEPTDDDGTKDEDDLNLNSPITFPSFSYTQLPIPKDLDTYSPEAKLHFLQSRRERKTAALEAEADRRREVVREKLAKRGLSEREIEWEMEGKWEREKGGEEGEGNGKGGRMEEWERERKRSLERRERRARERVEGRMG